MKLFRNYYFDETIDERANPESIISCKIYSREFETYEQSTGLHAACRKCTSANFCTQSISFNHFQLGRVLCVCIIYDVVLILFRCSARRWFISFFG